MHLPPPRSLQVVKRAGSRVLYLVLCFGYGVVNPALTRRQVRRHRALLLVRTGGGAQ